MNCGVTIPTLLKKYENIGMRKTTPAAKEIEVTDNGIGVEAKEIPRLFERFYRTDTARSREFGGSGLGLAIVKHIIEAHKQTINVRSRIGIGTTFAFTMKKV